MHLGDTPHSTLMRRIAHQSCPDSPEHAFRNSDCSLAGRRELNLHRPQFGPSRELPAPPPQTTQLSQWQACEFLTTSSSYSPSACTFRDRFRWPTERSISNSPRVFSDIQNREIDAFRSHGQRTTAFIAQNCSIPTVEKSPLNGATQSANTYMSSVGYRSMPRKPILSKGACRVRLRCEEYPHIMSAPCPVSSSENRLHRDALEAVWRDRPPKSD